MKLTVTIVCLMVFQTLASTGLCIERPEAFGNFLKLNTGEYLYAEDAPSLDFRLQNNFAVEFWYKLESVPEIPFQQRILLAKPGSYAFVILAEAGIYPKEGFLQPWIFPALYFASTTEEGGGLHGAVFGGISPGEWHHFSFQTWLEGGIRRSAAYHNGGKPNEQNLPVKTWCVDTDSRFYVGGLPRYAIEGLAEARLPYAPFASAPIYFDEIRLSIAPIGKPQIDAPPGPNPRTKALWHFSEGHDASVYKDSAGANTLFRQPLSVSADQALTTTWGRLKLRGF